MEVFSQKHIILLFHPKQLFIDMEIITRKRLTDLPWHKLYLVDIGQPHTLRALLKLCLIDEEVIIGGLISSHRLWKLFLTDVEVATGELGTHHPLQDLLSMDREVIIGKEITCLPLQKPFLINAEVITGEYIIPHSPLKQLLIVLVVIMGKLTAELPGTSSWVFVSRLRDLFEPGRPQRSEGFELLILPFAHQ